MLMVTWGLPNDGSSEERILILKYIVFWSNDICRHFVGETADSILIYHKFNFVV